MSKISDLAVIAGADLASTDLLETVDVSDASMAVSGTNKKITADELRIGMGIEAGADVTDATNVAAAGAVMDSGAQTVAGVKTFSSAPLVPGPVSEFEASTKGYVDQTALLDSEVDADIKTLTLPASTTISTWAKDLLDDADAATARTTLGVPAASTVAPSVKLTAAEYAALTPPDADTIYFVVG